jgi:uncharacterized Zn finger protein (UPF0148 family)
MVNLTVGLLFLLSFLILSLLNQGEYMLCPECNTNFEICGEGMYTCPNCQADIEVEKVETPAGQAFVGNAV